MRLAFTLIVLGLAACLAAEDEEPVSPSVATANRTLARTGFPSFPGKAKELQCYTWSGLSAGIYATFVLKEPDLSAYLASFPAGLDKATPIPRKLLAPPNAAAPWFTPDTIAAGTVLYRGRILNAAPEIFRLYVDAENTRVFLYYRWNNKRTYP